ncbi:hypothetical protein SLS60_002358 [Paraconiothyrium brasiliense]|uniref:Uncharacterized protein n=1 Tax=Paraconiothyrium brasiliense TaxID=300254 RepID=A0ABR3S1W4_9PLEO
MLGLTALPTSNTTTKPHIPLPASLSQKMRTLIALSRRVESIVHGLSYGLFNTEDKHRDAHIRMTHLRNMYAALRPEVDAELAHLGYRTGLEAPISIATNGLTPVANKITNQHDKGEHKHRYGPTSPQYTVDKALKRKAEETSTPSTQRAFKKQRKGSADSDFVETDCESESERKRKSKVEAQWPPDPITSLASVPLGRPDRERLSRWTWVNAVTMKGMVIEAEVETVESPLGTMGGW